MIRPIIIIALLLAAIAVPLPAYADESTRVFVDGQEISFDVPPTRSQGRIMVPFRGVFEALGVPEHNIEWIPEKNTVACIINGQNMFVVVGDNNIYLGSRTINSDVPAQIIEGRLMVPLRVIAEAALCRVDYDPSSETVSITKGINQVNIEVYPGYDESMRGMRDIYGRVDRFDIHSPQVFGQIAVQGDISTVVCEWYYVKGSQRQLVFSDLRQVEAGRVSSILPKEKYIPGQWVLAARINGNIFLESSFTLVDDPKLYGILPWMEGSYEGYFDTNLPAGVPGGYGKLVMNNGTIVTAEFGGGVYFNRGTTPWAYSGMFNNPKDWPRVCQIYFGLWEYPDGSRFVGFLSPRVVVRKDEDFDTCLSQWFNNGYFTNLDAVDQEKYQIIYYVSGNYTSSNGATREISGCIENLESSYRFDQMAITPGTYEDYLAEHK